MSDPDASPAPVAVLTGDIVRSSRLAPSALEEAMMALAAAAGAFSDWDGAVAAQFMRFRGDGWQCLAPCPRRALRAMLFLRARLRAVNRRFDTRISAGIGAAHLSASGGLEAAGGPAFELSGRGLDTMGRPQQFGLSWAQPPADAATVGAVVALADEVSRLWTPRQAEALAQALSPIDASQEALAARLGISQQAVGKHLRAGGAWALRRALSALESNSL